LDYTAGEGGVFYVAVTSYDNWNPLNPSGGDYDDSSGTGDYVLNVSITPTEDSTGLGTGAPQVFNDADIGGTVDMSSDDVLIGGGGSDLLVGGEGDDLLIGGEGADVFMFGSADGTDVVADFSLEDALVFEGFSDGEVDVAVSTNGDLVVGVGSGDDRTEVTLQDTAGSGYSISEDGQGNTVVTLDVDIPR